MQIEKEKHDLLEALGRFESLIILVRNCRLEEGAVRDKVLDQCEASHRFLKEQLLKLSIIPAESSKIVKI